jgi:N-acetyl-anhydromuramyl-L-alanine amidase AmpD
MKIIDLPLPASQYNMVKTSKKHIVLHHTCGNNDPRNVIQAWSADPARVATHYVIGSKSTRTNDVSQDGLIYRAISEDYYGWHLGLTDTQAHDKDSIAIELCNYGYLVKGTDGKFYTYVHSTVPEDQVVDLGFEFRGYRYWHKYTDAQIQALSELLPDIATRHSIAFEKGRVIDVTSFNLNEAFFTTKTLYTHVNVRGDKTDCAPQPNLISMLQKLHT